MTPGDAEREMDLCDGIAQEACTLKRIRAALTDLRVGRGLQGVNCITSWFCQVFAEIMQLIEKTI
jgi:hypothetical protein